MPGATITAPATIAPILSHLELPATPPPLAPARGPPLWEAELDQTLPGIRLVSSQSRSSSSIKP